MKKINFLIALILVFITGIDYANAIMTNQQASNVRKTYQTYRYKLRTCSPYTYNVDGDPYIVRIEGIYNRRCLVRFLGYNNAIECNFKNDSLKKFISLMPPPNYYAKSLDEIINMSDKEIDKMANAHTDYVMGVIFDDSIAKVCKSPNSENKENNAQ